MELGLVIVVCFVSSVCSAVVCFCAIKSATDSSRKSMQVVEEFATRRMESEAAAFKFVGDEFKRTLDKALCIHDDAKELRRIEQDEATNPPPSAAIRRRPVESGSLNGIERGDGEWVGGMPVG